MNDEKYSYHRAGNELSLIGFDLATMITAELDRSALCDSQYLKLCEDQDSHEFVSRITIGRLDRTSQLDGTDPKRLKVASIECIMGSDVRGGFNISQEDKSTEKAIRSAIESHSNKYRLHNFYYALDREILNPLT